MIISCITHADARDKKAHPFRGLTELGYEEVQSAAGRFRELIEDGTPPIEAIVSSPKARCVETAVLFAKSVNEFTATSELQLDPSLKAGSISGHEIFEMANRLQARHLLVSGHADLVQALPPNVTLIPEAANNGWFTTRPVLILMRYEAGEKWEEARVMACEGLVEKVWTDFIKS